MEGVHHVMVEPLLPSLAALSYGGRSEAALNPLVGLLFGMSLRLNWICLLVFASRSSTPR